MSKMNKCPFQTKEIYTVEYQGHQIGNKEVKRTVFIDCLGCECAAYDSFNGTCSKTGKQGRKSASLLGACYTMSFD